VVPSPYLLGNRINFAKHGDLMTCLHAHDENVLKAIVDENDTNNVKDGMRACVHGISKSDPNPVVIHKTKPKL
jgi:hypothetical protein